MYVENEVQAIPNGRRYYIGLSYFFFFRVWLVSNFKKAIAADLLIGIFTIQRQIAVTIKS